MHHAAALLLVSLLCQTELQNTARTQYETAIELLTKGRNYVEAARLLNLAIRVEPNNQDYHIALGCAFASRAAIVGDAAFSLGRFATDKLKYRKALEEWEKLPPARRLRGTGIPRPEPPILRTRDDKKPFDLNRKQASEEFDNLASQVGLHLKKAIGSAVTPEEKAKATFIQGWAVRLLRASSRYLDAQDRPSPDTDKRLFISALEDAPDDPQIWQAIGDSYVGDTWSAQQAIDVEKAAEAYKKSVSIERRNPRLWYRLYDLLRGRDQAAALAALEEAAHQDARNAYPRYRIAGLLFAGTPFSRFSEAMRDYVRRKSPTYDHAGIIASILDDPNLNEYTHIGHSAIGEIEKGNKLAEFSRPVYFGSAPKLLKAAWEWEYRVPNDDTQGLTIWHTVTMSAAAYAQVVTRQGALQNGISACQSLIEMGAKMAGNVFEESLPLSIYNLTRLQLGQSAGGSAYSTLCTILQEAGDISRLPEAIRKKDDFLARYRALIQRHFAARETAYSLY